MDVTPVLEFLREKIGLNPKSIGTTFLQKTVRARVEASGAASVEDYVKRASGSAEELNRLIESVVVHETSFFRNQTPFVTLKKYLSQFVLHKKRKLPLRMLCIPSSTGEEAYSMAMALFDMGLSANQFSIFAGDISEPALQFAKAGKYSAYSFRGKEIAFRKKYFTKSPDGTYLLNKEIRDVVRFDKTNILSDNFLAGHMPYDVIFCRNLLIYFDDAAKAKAINSLWGLLSEQGILFVGHAEGAYVSQYGLASIDFPMSFTFAKKMHAVAINDALNADKPVKKGSPPVQSKKKLIQARPLEVAGRLAAVMSAHDTNNEKKLAANKSQVGVEIAAARQLADEGSFGQAVAICEKLVSEGVEVAELYYLLGLAAGSNGDNLLAEEYLKKAIYLNADYPEALVYLSLLFDRMGNTGKAASLRKRAQRVKLRKENGKE